MTSSSIDAPGSAKSAHNSEDRKGSLRLAVKDGGKGVRVVGMLKLSPLRYCEYGNDAKRALK